MKENGIHSDLIDLDDREVRAFLEALYGKEAPRLYQVQLKKSARILQKKTIQNFRKEYNYSGAWKQEIKRRSGKTKTKVRRIARIASKRKDGVVTVKVHIMDDYKVKWLEMGTKLRHTKGRLIVGKYRLRPNAKRTYNLRVGKPADRGQIEPGRFFESAKRTSEEPMKASISKGIKEAISKAYKKAKSK